MNWKRQGCSPPLLLHSSCASACLPIFPAPFFPIAAVWFESRQDSLTHLYPSYLPSYCWCPCLYPTVYHSGRYLCRTPGTDVSIQPYKRKIEMYSCSNSQSSQLLSRAEKCWSIHLIDLELVPLTYALDFLK